MSAVSSKSTLAKLLATENLRVEHQKVSTAAFDLKNRTLILPIWKDMSTDLYDLLIGHEVGHALYTPAQGWHSEIDHRGMGVKSYLNVLEDARIERMIKDKFPGIRKNFFTGYQELFEKDFFGVKDRDISKLRFIDRINLHYKVGPFLNVQFSEEEQKFIARIDAMKTWDDVAVLAAELYELAKSEPEYDFDLETMMDDLGDEFEIVTSDEKSEGGSGTPSKSEEKTEDATEGDGETEEGNSSDASDSSDESDASAESSDKVVKAPEQKNEPKAEETNEESAAPSNGAKTDGSNSTPIFNDDPVSVTDQSFREMEDTFIDANSREYAYGILRKVDTKDYVVPMEWVVPNMRPKVYEHSYSSVELDYEELATKTFLDFRNKNQKYINLMVQEFEMKRKAAQFARAAVSKTGRLDVDRVWAHKISEDLFARNTVVPDGKNHGMILFLDMSGSMNGNMRGTIEQMVTLMMFCRKVRIPFEVYGFTNNQFVVTGHDSYPRAHAMIANRRGQLRVTDKDLTIGDNSFFLLQFVNSNCSAGKFNEVVRNLLMVAAAYDNRRSYSNRQTYRLPEFMGLASTPLEESIVVARSIADTFRKKHRVEVLNTVFLTDGDGDNNVNVRNKYGRYHMTLTDAETGATTTIKYDDHMRNQMQNALLDVYRKATGSRTMNFFIADTYCARRVAQNLHQHGADFDVKWRQEWKQKFFHTTNSYGFDDRFIVPGGNDLQIDEDVLDTDATNARDLTKAFKKFQNKKQTNRVLLSKMIQAVA